MFDLENAIRTWKATLEANDAFGQRDVAELEDHLRDQIDDLRKSGTSLEMAFQVATEKIGSHQELAREFAKEGPHRFFSVRTEWLLIGMALQLVVLDLLHTADSAAASVCAWFGLPVTGWSRAVDMLFVVGVVAGLVVCARRLLLARGISDHMQASRALIIALPLFLVLFLLGQAGLRALATRLASPALFQWHMLGSQCAMLVRFSIPVLLLVHVLWNRKRVHTDQIQGDARIAWLLTGAMIYVCLSPLCWHLAWGMVLLYSSIGVSPQFLALTGALLFITSLIVALAWLLERAQRRHSLFSRHLWAQVAGIVLASSIAFVQAPSSWLIELLERVGSEWWRPTLMLHQLSFSLLTLSAVVLLSVCALRLHGHSSSRTPVEA